MFHRVLFSLFLLVPLLSGGVSRAQETPVAGGIRPPIIRRTTPSSEERPTWQDAIVARVNGVPVLLSEVRDMILNEELSTSAIGAEDLRGDAFREALTRAIDRKLLVQEAHLSDLTVDSAQIAARIDEIIARMVAEAGGRAEFMHSIRRGLMDFDSLRTALIRQETERQLAAEIVAMRVVVSAREVDVFAQKRRDEGKSIEEVRLAQIVVRCRPEQQETAEGKAAYAKALRLAQEVGRDRDRFFEVASRETENAVQRQRAGLLGWVDPRGLVPAMREAVDAMKPGDVSAPVTTDQGYHVLLVIDRRTARDLLFAEKFIDAQIELLDRLRESATIEVYDLAT